MKEDGGEGNVSGSFQPARWCIFIVRTRWRQEERPVMTSAIKRHHQRNGFSVNISARPRAFRFIVLLVSQRGSDVDRHAAEKQ